MSWLNDYVFDVRTAESFTNRYKRRLHAINAEEFELEKQLKRAFEVSSLGENTVPCLVLYWLVSSLELIVFVSF